MSEEQKTVVEWLSAENFPKVLDRLVKEGWVTVEGDKVILTDKGRAHAAQLTKP